MSGSEWFEPVLAFTGLLLSAFFSGTELAYISANPLQLEVWSMQGKWGARQAHALVQAPGRFLTGILIGTTLANIVATSFATSWLVRLGWHPLVVLGTIAGFILFFGEVLPKTISGERPNQTLRFLAPLFNLVKTVLWPLTAPLSALSHFLASDKVTTHSRDDLRLLFAGGEPESRMKTEEQALIEQVFEFGETAVARVMTPRTEMVAVPESASFEEVVHSLIESGYSKLPVYRESLDDILGVIYLYDLFKSRKDVASLIRPVTMFPHSNTTLDVLMQLQRLNRSIAIVLDEYGGTAGLVTLEDLFEELFGEFEDEFDQGLPPIRQLPDGSVMALGSVRIEDLNENTPLTIPEGDYDTLAGYLTYTLGRFPNLGERLYLPIGIVTIMKATPRKIEQVQITLSK